jgi:hypothetical protein
VETQGFYSVQVSVVGPDVWSGRASQEVFVDLSDVGLASMYPAGLTLERVMLRATMDISAHAISLTSRPRPGQQGHQYSHAPGRPNLHLVSSSRRPRQVSGIDLTTSSRAPHFARCLRLSAWNDDQTDWAAASSIFLTSKFRPWARTLQAIRASLLASAIASTLRCSRFLAASIQGLSP